MFDIYLKVQFEADITNEQLRDIMKFSVGSLIIGKSVVLYARYYRRSGDIYFVFRVNINKNIAKNIGSIKIRHFLDHPQIKSSSITWIKEIESNPKLKFILE